ncbi:MAG: 4-(cytidine 5'-diphospho)-2-C-methyl-D-erythritol kinase [Burkholderiaceae bacterium]
MTERTEPMVALRNCPAPAKLNLCLHVLGRRDDGYHEIDTVFDLIDLQDTLSFTLRSDSAIMRRGNVHGLAQDTDLCVRAARLFAAATGTQYGVDIDVQKRIPMGGGLGGGSSNAATTLLALNRLWGIHWPVARVARLALQLGADVPVFVHGTAAHAQGIGERLQPLELPEQFYVLVAPPAAVPTSEIFGAPELTRDSKPLKISVFSRSLIGEHGRNDLEPVACERYPAVDQALRALNRFAARSDGRRSSRQASARGSHSEQDPGAVAWRSARMSGSGACVFLPVASWDDACRIRDLAADLDVGQVHAVRSMARHPLRNWAFVRP